MMAFSIRLIALCVAALGFFGSTISWAQNSMEIIVDKYELQQCRPQLLSISQELIKEKPHRLHLDQPKGNQDKYPLTILGVISYNDADAQVVFNASPLADGGCEVSYVESFMITESCIEAREQVFKKWKYIGKLSDDSFFLRHKERLTRNATLTAVKNGTECLVTRRHSGI
ncbi:MAG: hypothetical protein ACPGMR_04750 [Pontibacterium sp.]